MPYIGAYDWREIGGTSLIGIFKLYMAVNLVAQMSDLSNVRSSMLLAQGPCLRQASGGGCPT